MGIIGGGCSPLHPPLSLPVVCAGIAIFAVVRGGGCTRGHVGAVYLSKPVVIVFIAGGLGRRAATTVGLSMPVVVSIVSGLGAAGRIGSTNKGGGGVQGLN